MIRRWLPLSLVLLPGPALAHSFKTGTDAYGAFLEGAGVILSTPALILPLIAFAILLGLWKPEGLLRIWPIFLVGQLAGMALSPLVGASIALVPIAFGLVIGVLAALAPSERLGRAMGPFALLVGASVLAAALEGHGYGEIGVGIRFGLFFGVNFATAAAAGVARYLLERWPGDVTRIGWRVAASWVSAILVLYLAFSLTGQAT